ncbi:MAG: hypothetical protein CL678_17640 [Bdellovibrionaceae bacterium]|nr:hypothetical protein [Pseudobdellovibrionaceae bacterium]|tara:strand:+ start:2272 stop:3939 length:1668 start_codon:yes stop_codon:yes gene_type:complete
MDSCLGLAILGSCEYLPNKPDIHLISFGDTISVIALLIAFTQLVSLFKKSKLEGYLKKYYWLWAALPLIFVLFAGILPLIPGNAVPLLGYPIFWEFLAAIVLGIAVIQVIRIYVSKLKFSKKRPEKLLNIIMGVIAKGEAKDLAELAANLVYFIPDFVAVVKKYDVEKWKVKTDQIKENPHANEFSYVSGIIDVLADPFFCSVVVRKEPALIAKLVNESKKQECSGTYFKPFVWELIKQGIQQEDSIFRRETQFWGLGSFKSLSNIVFSDFEVNESFLPLSFWSPTLIKNIDEETFESFAKMFLLMIDAYFSAGRFYEHSFSIYSPGKTLVEYPKHNIYRIDDYPDSDIGECLGYKYLWVSERTLVKIIDKMLEVENLREESFIKYCNEVDKKNDHSIFKLIAEWSYEIFESAAHTRKHDEQLRFLVIDLWMKIYPIGESTEIHSQIQNRLEPLILEKVNENLEKGYYPALSRVMISIFGLYIPEKTKQSREAVFCRKFYKYFREHFLELYEKDQEKALDMLPANTTFDSDNLVLIQKNPWRKTERKMSVKKTDS